MPCPSRRASSVALVTAVLIAGSWWWVDQDRRQWHAAHAMAVEPQSVRPSIPSIVWPKGVPHDGRWEGDRWVRALRDFAKIHSVALYSGPLEESDELKRAASPELIIRLQNFAASNLRRAERGDEPGLVAFYPGPMPFEVRRVEVNDAETTAVVETCAPEVLGYDHQEDPREVMARDFGIVVRWEMRQVGGRNIQVADVRYGALCDIEDVHYGIFDPEPQQPLPTRPPHATDPPGQQSDVARPFPDLGPNDVTAFDDGVLDDVDTGPIAELTRQVDRDAEASSAAAEAAPRATCAGASASIGNASSGTRDSLVDSLRPWIDRIDVSHSALLAQEGGDVELYLESLTGNYDSIVKEARDEAGDV